MSFLNIVKNDMLAAAYKVNSSENKIRFTTFVMLMLTPEFRLVLSYRIYSSVYRRGYIKLSMFLYLWAKKKYSSDIHPCCNIGVPIKLGHHMSIVIGPDVCIGNNVYIMNNVSIGNKTVGGANRMPTIGNDVIIGVGARLLGSIDIGNNAYIGANSGVICNVPQKQTWAGIPAKKIS